MSAKKLITLRPAGTDIREYLNCEFVIQNVHIATNPMLHVTIRLFGDSVFVNWAPFALVFETVLIHSCSKA